MKIAVPTKNNSVDNHFGHCEYYTIFTIDEKNQIIEIEEMKSPQGCGCKSNVASILKNKGVTIMLAGNMGDGALQVLTKHNIQVFRGNNGDTKMLIENFLQGKIVDSGKGCESHEHHHGETQHVCRH